MEQHHLVVILERMESKLELVVEGHDALRLEIQALAEKTDERFDLVDFKIDTFKQQIDHVEEQLSRKIDTVVTDLKAHRRDTEAHRQGYRVGEE